MFPGPSRVTVLLAGAILFQMALLLRLATADAETAPAPGVAMPPVPGSGPVPEFPGPRLPALADLSATLQRPVFMAERRMPATEDAGELAGIPDAMGGGQQQRFRVSAIIFNEGSKLAVVSDQLSGTISRMREMDVFAGWTVEAIKADHVVLVRGAEKALLRLWQFRKPERRQPGEIRPVVPEGGEEQGAGKAVTPK